MCGAAGWRFIPSFCGQPYGQLGIITKKTKLIKHLGLSTKTDQCGSFRDGIRGHLSGSQRHLRTEWAIQGVQDIGTGLRHFQTE